MVRTALHVVPVQIPKPAFVSDGLHEKPQEHERSCEAQKDESTEGHLRAFIPGGTITYSKILTAMLGWILVFWTTIPSRHINGVASDVYCSGILSL